MADPSPDDYFLEIESHFASRRGTPFLFSAKDWALMKSWWEEKVPIALILEAIDRCFDHRAASGRKGTISSLSYCRHAVREMWDERKELQVGAEGGVPEREAAPLLEALACELETAAAETKDRALRKVLADAAAEVRAIRAVEPVPAIEQALLGVEDRLLAAIASSMPPSDLEELRAEVERALGPHKLDPSVAERTRQANLRRLLRRRFGLSRLSLFR